MTRSPLWREFESGGGVPSRTVRVLMLAAAAACLATTIALPMHWPQQTLLAAITLGFALWMHRNSSSRQVTLALVFLSVAFSARYAVFRLSAVAAFLRDPGSHPAPLDAFFVCMLLLAEGYAFAVLLLGYLQTAWPLERAPAPLPDDSQQWPAVDVLIPTLNEPLELVRYTALAAMNIDWPAEKLRVWVLDDGARSEFREFAEDAGIGYLARADNRGAKAGNINHALQHTTAPFVAVFDCDQVPTRSFLQVTMGWFLRDARLAVVQTPHRFYSPDPFERNLAGFGATPGEEQLFHGVIQQGNDLWNAASFCGSCGVLRRSALAEVGGLAMETVTEDAHTSLRLQKRGWNTAFINIPQAAGLATERLSAHVRQRTRWARGMMQVLRLEHPLFADGLRWEQRLCYLNAVAYFLCALPRLIFLTAPVIYLVLGRTTIPGAWAAIVAYVLPHLLLAGLARTRIYGHSRHALWNEIYETVMAPYILMPTLAALVNPGQARFQVTAKGGLVEREFYDARTARPYLVLIAFNLIALACAVPRLLFLRPVAYTGWLAAVSTWVSGLHTAAAGAVWINAAWALFNLALLGVAAGVARESAQRRRSVRVALAVPADVILADGTMLQGVTCDLSGGGVRAKTMDALKARPGDATQFILPLLDGAVTLSATVVSADGGELRAQFGPLGLREAEAVTTLLYSRADAWLGWGEAARPDTALRGLGRVLGLSVRGVWRTLGGSPAREEAAESRLVTNIAPLLLVALLLGPSALSARAAQTATETVPRPTAAATANAAAAPAANLASLPRPFLTPGAGAVVQLVFAAPPHAKAIRAAGIVASWLGVESGAGAVRFAVSIGTIPPGNSIVLAEGDSPMLNRLAIKAVPGPLVAIRNNPGDLSSSVLLLTGNSADEMLTAAMALALEGNTWQGTQTLIDGFRAPGMRVPDDAPRWLSTDHIATLAQAQIRGESGELQGDGSRPLTATLRLPPDLDWKDGNYSDRTNLALHLDYRYNAVPLGEGSTLQVSVNGAYVSSTPMPHTDKASEVLETVVPVPVSELRPGDNDFTFQFAFRPAQSGDHGGANHMPPANFMGAVLKDSYLDIGGIPHWTELPDLALFARSGYPFTRLADLAETSIVLPDTPTAHELEAFLALMARFGAQTGLPAVSLSVTNASAIGATGRSEEGKDVLILGTPQDQPAIAQLSAALPVEVRPGHMRLSGAEGIFGSLAQSVLGRLKKRGSALDVQRFGEIESAGELPDATMEEIEWPRGSGRTALVIALGEDAAASSFVDAVDGTAANGIAQSVSVLHGARFSSYRLGNDAYWVGAISPWRKAEFQLEELPWLIAVTTGVVCFLLAALLQARLRRRARERLQVPV